jgi:pyruvate kinase
MWAVTAVDAEGLSAQTNRTAYVEAGSVVRLCRDGRTVAEGRFGGLPPLTAPLVLRPGDLLNLTTSPAAPGDDGGPTIACTLPEVFARVRAGERILFDDGKITGVIREVRPDRLRIEITQTPSAGAKLGADKGINLPDSDLRLPGLTAKDLADLDFVAAGAEMVGLSFVRGADDVGRVQAELAARGAKLGIVLKIETRAAFEHLPRLLLTGLRTPPVGVMVARGDLGVEMGFERLAEVQEEILWLCEAAHVPVVWATQVLEGLAKSGMPSRAEVTDAAMAGRAECVMLNNGPYVVEAVRFLDNVPRRMRDHRQEKKRAMLRKLSVSALA